MKSSRWTMSESREKLAVLLISILILFAAAPLFTTIHSKKFDTITWKVDRADDWLPYHERALSVLKDGLLMKLVEGPYSRPGGFGYVYFVALCYRIFGPKPQAVYLIHMLLGIFSVVLYLWLARNRCGLTAYKVYAILLLTLVIVDVWWSAWQYPSRLLSENLLLPLLAIAVCQFARFLERPTVINAFLCGLLCGACFLVRPNTILLPLGWAAVAVMRLRYEHWKAARVVMALLAGTAAMAALLVWRDYEVGARAALHVVSTRHDWLLPSSFWAAFPFYGRRAMYLLGFHNFLNPTVYIRPHWLAGWIGAVLYLASTLRREPRSIFDVSLLVLLVCYYMPLLAVGHIANYGFRMMFPAMPVVFYLASRYVDERRSRAEAIALRAAEPLS